MTYKPHFQPSFGISRSHKHTLTENSGYQLILDQLSITFGNNARLYVTGDTARTLEPKLSEIAIDDSQAPEERLAAAQELMTDAGAAVFEPKELDTI